jgi:hypothetical protein
MKRILFTILLALFLITGTTQLKAADITVAWDAYTDQANVDGFYIYICTASPCEALGANRAATVTNKALTTFVVTGQTIGQKYAVMTAYKGTIESVKSNEGNGVIRPLPMHNVIITIGP